MSSRNAAFHEGALAGVLLSPKLAVLGLGGVGLLLWPRPLRWELCVPIGAVLAGGSASVQWAYYKKHM